MTFTAKPIPPETSARIVDLYVNGGLSANAIAPKVRVCARRILRHLEDMNIPIRSRHAWTPGKVFSRVKADPEFTIPPHVSLEAYCKAIYAACPWGFDLKAAREGLRP